MFVCCLFSWPYNPLWLYFYSPVKDFSLLVLEVSRSYTNSRHSRWDFSGQVINPSQRPLPDNTQHSQQTNIHAPGGIPTHDLSRRAAKDLNLRSRGHWDRLSRQCRLGINMSHQSPTSNHLCRICISAKDMI